MLEINKQKGQNKGVYEVRSLFYCFINFKGSLLPTRDILFFAFS